MCWKIHDADSNAVVDSTHLEKASIMTKMNLFPAASALSESDIVEVKHFERVV